MWNSQERINILGVNVTNITVNELHEYIDDCKLKDRKSLILNVNVNCLDLAYRHAWLRQFLNNADVVFCDGAGVILGAKILGHNVPERITFADWIWQLSEFAESRGITLFFLGAYPGISEKAAEILKSQYPDLRIVDTHHGYFDKNLNSLENSSVISKINKSKPDILIVGFGMPKQELWLMENWHQIDANIALTGGAVFDFVSGTLRRAPRWMTDHSLEWMGRFIIEPSRLWKRYLIANPLFLMRILRQKFVQKPPNFNE